MARFFGAVVALACAAPTAALRAGAGGKVTPVEKVISLLTQLHEQVQEEGAREAAEAKKYEVWCKHQQDEKEHQIEKSTKLIAAMTTKIDALDADITSLNGDVTDLGTAITDIEGEIETEESTREDERKDYVKEDKNVTEAIEAVEGAIETLRASKKKLSDDAKLDLMQVKTTLASGLKPTGLAVVSSLLDHRFRKGPSYSYSSNDIISVLQNLMTQFKSRKQALFDDEFRLKSVSEKKVLGLTNEMKFKKKEKDQKEAIASAKTVEKEDLTKEKTEETTAKEADEAFKTELDTTCSDKASEYDQRSGVRKEELEKLEEAVKILKSDVEPKYSANKKLVGLQHKVVVRHAAVVAAPSFIEEEQVVEHAKEVAAAPKKVLQLLDQAAKRLHSPALAALATKVYMHADHFVKVRGLIKDLVKRLEDEATDEETQKSFCDTEMAKATEERDAQNLNIELASAVNVKKSAEKKTKKEEVAVLSQEVADLNKALHEAQAMRKKEKAMNEKTVADAKEGKAAVDEAITILKGFYEGSFIQRQPAKDRRGKTIDDMAPKTSFEGDYEGNKDAASGIIGLLEVILDDFDRTVTTVEKAEADAEKDFKDFETETDTSIKDKTTEKEGKESKIKVLDLAITASADAVQEAKDMLELAKKELMSLTSQCVDGEESAEERAARRKEEIDALKEALNILENWEG